VCTEVGWASYAPNMMNNKIHTLNVLNVFFCPSKMIIVHCVVKKLFHPMCRSGPIKDICGRRSKTIHGWKECDNIFDFEIVLEWQLMNEVIFYQGTQTTTNNTWTTNKPIKHQAVAILKLSENSLGEQTSRKKFFFHTKMLYKIIKKDKRLWFGLQT
jgi:hypothetical protein